jgi:hypothetical protein
VTIDLNASSSVDRLSRLVTTFDNVPDAPIRSFDLRITGGKHGIIVVSGKPGTCDRDKTIDARFTGQNGKTLETSPAATVSGCRPHVVRSSASASAVTLRLSGLGTGRLSVAGSLVRRATRSIKSATEASIAARLSARARAILHRHGHVAVTVKARFVPKRGKATSISKRITVRR